MNLLSVDSLSKSMGEKNLFTKISFGIEAGEKLALIGDNGCGKTTLLRLLAGRELPDGGQIATNNASDLSYLEQIPVYAPGDTVLDHVFRDDSPEMLLIRDYELCLQQLERGGSAVLEEKLAGLIGKMDHLDCWNKESEIKSILTELGISDVSVRMDTLSGGMLKKVSLGRALVRQSNLLLLDEPTNHLDIATICWLEEYLQKTTQGVIIVTHDRYFLDKICSRILELSEGALLRFDGNYSYYLEKKAEQLQSKAKEQERIGVVLRRELEWLHRGPRARRGKSKSRTEKVYDLMDKQERESASQAEFAVSERRLGKKVLEVIEVAKGFDGKPVICPFSYSFKKGERLGLIGPNGSGKTTFLKILTGELEPDRGSVDKGINTVFGYFDQLSAAMDEEQTILAYMQDAAEYMKLDNGASIGMTQLLENFSFPRGMLYTRIRYLSGGERRRLYLVKMLLSSPNFLVLDEPTNDFDIKTLSMLEDFLNEFPGCFTVVSHDRYFLDRTVDFLFIFDGQGRIFGFGGNYSQYQEYRRQQISQELQSQSAVKPVAKKAKDGGEKRKLTFNEQREYARLGEEIEVLEGEQRELEAFFSSGETGGEKLKAAQQRYQQVLEEIEEKTTRWIELAEWLE